MNYYLTQEQYEQLREFIQHLDAIEDKFFLDELLGQIGNQKASDPV